MVVLWMRRSSTAFLLPGLVMISVAACFSRTGWQYEWQWAQSNMAGAAVAIGVVLAGLTAHDQANRLRGLQVIEGASTRQRRAALALPVANVLLGLVAWSFGAVVTVVRVAANGVAGLPDPWPLIEVPAVLSAFVAFGMLIGSTWQSKAAGALAVVTSYAVFAFAYVLGFGGYLLQTGGATGSLTGSFRPVGFTAGLVAANLTLAIVCITSSFAFARHRLKDRGSWALAAVAVVVFSVVSLSLRESGYMRKPYAVASDVPICVGAEPALCAPSDSRRALEIVRPGVSAAARKLRDAGLATMPRYVLPVGVRHLSRGDGVLSLDLENVRGSNLGFANLVQTFSTPSNCAAFYRSEPTGLSRDQQVVGNWIIGVLKDGSTSMSSNVAESYRRLQSCRVYSGNMLQ